MGLEVTVRALIRKAFCADHSKMFIQVRRRNIGREADALYAGVLFLNDQAGHIIPPFGSGHALRRGEKPDSAAQQVFIAS